MVALAAGGRPFDDALAAELAAEDELTLLCGRYEGFDERVHEHLATDVVSIGPYVLAGGELAAMVVCDAVLRKLPGALGHEDSAVEESFSQALGGAPEYPHYTRPRRMARRTACPRFCSPATTRRVREWRLRAEPPPRPAPDAADPRDRGARPGPFATIRRRAPGPTALAPSLSS